MKAITLRAVSVGTCLAVLPMLANADPEGAERLGTVSFQNSCASAVSADINRGVALLHDFWYEEARPQFERILKVDPSCAMAHWGIALSGFHQIWERPNAAGMAAGWRELQAAQAPAAKSARERAYIAALSDFFRPGSDDYPKRIGRYATAMGKLYADNPQDVDAGAFYALALLAAASPNDTTLSAEHQAMSVLTALWSRYPDHPGLVHYIIHACDNPSMAADGLAAARHYGEIAPSGPHAVHMPGHIYARLGLWPEDIAANVASVDASALAGEHHESGWMDQFHSDDFLLYAYLQSGQDAKARATIAASNAAIAHFKSMPNMAEHTMTGMFSYYSTKLPVFYTLEMRDWKAASQLKPIDGAPPQTQTTTYWGRVIADGHLHLGAQARADLASYDSLVAEIRKGSMAYLADGVGAKIERGEMAAWAAFADGKVDEAARQMSASADLQDKVGQGEVDIPAREMLADMLLESDRANEALADYQQSLILSPNRFNGLYGAGQAAEKAGEPAAARGYYIALLKSTDNGSMTARTEVKHAQSFISVASASAR
jgi:tetratricopeptide (TPR) repeat protein